MGWTLLRLSAWPTTFWRKKERKRLALDTLSYYDKTEPHGDDWTYFRKIEAQRGRAGIHIDGSINRYFSRFACISDFCPLPGALGSGQTLDTERADAVRRGGYRAVLSGIGGDEFIGVSPIHARIWAISLCNLSSLD